MNRNIAKQFTATLSLLDVASNKTHKYKCFHGEDIQLTVNVVGENKEPIDLSNTSVKIYFTLDKNVNEPVYRQDTGIVVDNLGIITVMLEKSYIRIGNNTLKIVLYDEDQTVFLQPLIISCIDPLIGELPDLEIPDDIDVRDELYDIRRIIDNFDSQLGEKLNITDRRRLVTNEILNNTLCSFIVDDGNRAFDTEYKPIFDKYGVKCTHAIVPAWVGTRSEFYTLNELKKLQREGYDIVGHSYSHDVMFKPENILNTSYNDIDKDFKKCHEYLLKNGFNGYDTIVYPYGSFKTREIEIKNIARKYFDNGVANNEIVGNNEPLDNMFISRKFIRREDTFNSIKLLIDTAILEKKWFILSLHLDGACSPELLDEIIGYIKSKNIRILPFTQANELKGNVLSVGEYSTGKCFQVSRSGKVNATGSEVITFKESRSTDINASPYNYKDNTVTTFSIDPNADTVTGIGGTISVYRTGADDFIYQLYTPYTKNDLYLRHWDFRSNPTGWREWSKLNVDNKIDVDINSFELANDWTVFEVRTQVTQTTDTIKANICIEHPNRTGSYSKDEYILTIPNFTNYNEYKQRMESGVMVSNSEYKVFYYLVEVNSNYIRIKMLEEHLETDIRWLNFNFTI